MPRLRRRILLRYSIYRRAIINEGLKLDLDHQLKLKRKAKKLQLLNLKSNCSLVLQPNHLPKNEPYRSSADQIDDLELDSKSLLHYNNKMKVEYTDLAEIERSHRDLKKAMKTCLNMRLFQIMMESILSDCSNLYYFDNKKDLFKY